MLILKPENCLKMHPQDLRASLDAGVVYYCIIIMKSKASSASGPRPHCPLNVFI